MYEEHSEYERGPGYPAEGGDRGDRDHPGQRPEQPVAGEPAATAADACFLFLHARYGSEAISVIGPGGDLLYESESVQRILGYRHADEVSPTGDWFRYVHPEDVQKLQQALEAAYVTPGESPPVEYRVEHADGGWRWLESRGVNLLDDPRVEGILVSTREITARKEAEHGLQESERRFWQLFEQSVDAVIVHDGRGNVVDANHQALASLGYTREELLRMKVSDYETELLSEEERARKEGAGGTLWQRVVASEPGEVVGVHLGEHLTKEGSTFPVEVRVGGVDYGGERMILSSIRDITERRALEERLRQQALYDSLTGLPGRRLLDGRLREALARSGPAGERRPAVLFIDVNNLKVVNDSLGHATGDKLLCAIGERLERCIGEKDTVARFGGDEFVVLLRGSRNSASGEAPEDYASRVARRVLGELNAPLRVSEPGEHEVPVTVSIGVAVAPSPDPRLTEPSGEQAGSTDAAEDLIRQADAAMYRAKSSGGGDYTVFEPGMDQGNLERLELSSELHRAIERGELRTYYQHKIDLATGGVAGWEALLRWEHPERGFIQPETFIPLAEETGLIVPIGKWVLEQACRQASVWRERHPKEPGQFMSVNLSAKQFADPGLESEIMRTLERTGLPAAALDLEITEKVLMDDEDSEFARIRELKELGLSFSLDDFGTGYSSLASLKRIPVDFVKIARTFVAGVPGDHEDEAFVRAMVSLARALGLGVVAEGIEREEQWRRLVELGCGHGQGYYFSPPLPEAEASSSMSRIERAAAEAGRKKG